MQIGPYEVIKELARGAQGAVYHARDPRTGQAVALKQVNASHPRIRRRFETEVVALCRLTHPNLVRVLDHGDDASGLWVAQELIEGHSLQHRLRRWGRFGVGESARIVTGLARALEHAHRAGVLHRDVKPDNVLLRPDGEPVLVDFGVAQDLQSDAPRLSQTGEFLGSPGYWSPEQAQGALRDLGPATDVYGLGATLYALLSGHPPIEAQTLASYLDLSRFGDITPLPEANPQVPPELWEVCARCLAVDPGERYRTAEDLADALEPFVAFAPTAARRRVAPLALLGVALGVGAAGWAFWGDAEPAPGAEGTPAVAANAQANPELEALLEEAGHAFEADDYARVLAVLDRAQALAPDDARVWSKRGVTLIFAERMDEAQAALAHALELDPDSPGILRNWGSLGAMLDEPSMALEGYGRAAELEPGDPVALHGMGGALFLLGRHPEAEQVLNRALTLDAGYPNSWLRRGQIRAERGDLTGALEDLDQALALSPKDPTSLGWRAEIHVRLGSGEPALVDLDALERIQPETPVVPRLRLQALLVLERYAEAETLASHMLLRWPEDPRVWRERGSLRFMRSDYLGALSDARRALALSPDDPELHLAEGSTLMRLNRMREAVASTRRALELNPTSVTAHANLAGQLLLLDELEAAEAAARRGMELDPAHLLPRQNLSAILIQDGRADQAQQVLEALLLEDPTDSLTLTLLGSARLKLGAFERAAETLRESLAYSPGPERISALGFLACAEARAGDFVAARQTLFECRNLAPSHSTTYQAQAVLCLEQGDLEGAQRACEAALANSELPAMRRCVEEIQAEVRARARAMDERTGPR